MFLQEVHKVILDKQVYLLMYAPARRFCFTDFNGKISDWKDLSVKGIISYCIVGSETCPKTGRRHLQGYFEIPKRRTISGLIRKNIDWGPHLEVARGTLHHNKVYCSKEGDVEEWGDPMKSGERSDLVAITKELVEKKVTLEALADEQPDTYHKYKHTFRDIMGMKIKPRTTKPEVMWIHGKAGTGKTVEAFKESLKWGENNVFWYTPDNEFWNGYCGQKCVIIDDHRAANLKYNELLRKLDRFPNKCKIKGKDPVEFVAEKIIITSCYSPEECYKGQIEFGDGIDQLLRRIDVTLCLDPPEIVIEPIPDPPDTDGDGNIIA